MEVVMVGVEIPVRPMLYLQYSKLSHYHIPLVGLLQLYILSLELTWESVKSRRTTTQSGMGNCSLVAMADGSHKSLVRNSLLLASPNWPPMHRW